MTEENNVPVIYMLLAENIDRAPANPDSKSANWRLVFTTGSRRGVPTEAWKVASQVAKEFDVCVTWWTTTAALSSDLVGLDSDLVSRLDASRGTTRRVSLETSRSR